MKLVFDGDVKRTEKPIALDDDCDIEHNVREEEEPPRPEGGLKQKSYLFLKKRKFPPRSAGKKTEKTDKSPF